MITTNQGFWRDDLDDRPVKVTIYCMAYNQAGFIRQTLDSFVSQRADFRFEAIVHDDASTDGTSDIIREYATRFPSIIKPIIQAENQYSRKGQKAIFEIMGAHIRGEYIAFCDGDDYWIDEYKLQKQVEILDNNPDVALCYCMAKEYVQQTGQFGDDIGGPHTDFAHLLIDNVIPSPTVLLRSEILDRYHATDHARQSWLMGDYPLWMWASLQGRLVFTPEVMAVYRVITPSLSHPVDYKGYLRFAKSYLDIKNHFRHCYLGDADSHINLSDSWIDVQCHINDGDCLWLKSFCSTREYGTLSRSVRLTIDIAALAPLSCRLIRGMLAFKYRGRYKKINRHPDD